MENGQFFALGHFDGYVSIRNKSGDEVSKIHRGTSPVWCLSWNSKINQVEDSVLAIADSNQMLSFYKVDGSIIGKEKRLYADAYSLSYSNDGSMILLSDSKSRLQMWTNEGIKIGEVTLDSGSVKCTKYLNDNIKFALGSEDGRLEVRKLHVDPLAATHRSRFTYRNNLTDVVIQHLVTNQKARIRCRDLVRKLAIYRNQLAIGLTGRIILYELNMDDENDMHYKLKQKLSFENLTQDFAVTSRNLFIARGPVLELYDFNGEKVMDWEFDSHISTLNMTGGARGRECCLVGTKTGEVSQVFIGHTFPISILHAKCAIRSIDISLCRTKFAIVDESNCLTVYDLEKQEIVFQDSGVTAAKWNLECEDLLVYSGNGSMKVKHTLLDPISNHLGGDVASFLGIQLFYSNGTDALQSMALSISSIVHKLTYLGQLKAAYDIACFGVPIEEMRALGLKAMEMADLDLARKCFYQSKSLYYLDLIQTITAKHQSNPLLIQAELKAINGDFTGVRFYIFHHVLIL